MSHDKYDNKICSRCLTNLIVEIQRHDREHKNFSFTCEWRNGNPPDNCPYLLEHTVNYQDTWLDKLIKWFKR